MQELEGQVEEIIYRNEINGYTVCIFDVEKSGSITAVGYLPFIEKGDTLKIIGQNTMHKDYGEQFKIETFEKVMPKTIDGLIKYLGSGIIKGIGPATAKRIVKKFGEETLMVMKTEPERLGTVKGITPERAVEICEEFVQKWELWEIVSFLERYGVGANNAQRVYKELGPIAIKTIENNPYVLTDIVYNVDFKQIDKIAMQMGIDSNFKARVEAGIKYALVIASNNGNSCVIKENLIEYVKELLQIERDTVENELINCRANGIIVIDEFDEQEWVFLTSFYKIEENIAKKIEKMLSEPNNKKIKDFNKYLKETEKENTIKLSEMQLNAIKTINENNITIITGGPGTGKTTIIKFIIEIFKKDSKKVSLCAPTGRAAKRMSEATGVEAKTIHRLLELVNISDENYFKNIETEVQMIKSEIIIIDQMSMVDMFLMNYLLKGIYSTTKLVFVGDVNQLASVGPGMILQDLIESSIIPTVHLNTIFRQAAESKIIRNAHNVNSGEPFLKKEEQEGLKDDFFYMNLSNSNEIVENVLSLSTSRLRKFGDYEFFKNIQVITPTRKGTLGIKELNKALQNVLNPSSPSKRERHYGDYTFREGDKVMQIKNNYDIEWRNKNNSEITGQGIFNGELGIIKSIDSSDKIIKIEFDDEKEAYYEFSNLEELDLAYAITIHKSQGSEFDVVILVISSSSSKLLTRNLLYTGITRAKKLLIVIGNGKILEFMIQNVHTKTRNTGLKEKLKRIDNSNNF